MDFNGLEQLSLGPPPSHPWLLLRVSPAQGAVPVLSCKVLNLAWFGLPAHFHHLEGQGWAANCPKIGV